MTAVSSLFLIIPLIIPPIIPPIIPLIIPLIIPNYSLSYPQQACQFLVVVWCTFHVLNCPDGVQARK